MTGGQLGMIDEGLVITKPCPWVMSLSHLGPLGIRTEAQRSLRCVEWRLRDHHCRAADVTESTAVSE